MATLTPLKPLSAGTTGTIFGYSRVSGAWQRDFTTPAGSAWPLSLDEAITSSEADGDKGVSQDYGSNTTSTDTSAMTDVDADFASMDTLSFRYSSVDFGPYSDDSGGFGIRIVNGATILAAATSGGAVQYMDYFDGTSWNNSTSTSDTAPGYDKTVAFGYVNTTATKTDWDGASVEYTFDDSRNMGSDQSTVVLVDFEITGTYTTSGTSATVTLTTAVDGVAGLTAPTLSAGATVDLTTASVDAIGDVPDVTVSVSKVITLADAVDAVANLTAPTVSAGATVTLTTAVAAVGDVPAVVVTNPEDAGFGTFAHYRGDEYPPVTVAAGVWGNFAHYRGDEYSSGVDINAVEEPGATVTLADAVDGVANIVAPTLSAGATATLTNAVDAIGDVPAVTVSTVTNATVTLTGAVAAIGGVPAVTVSAGATVALTTAVDAVGGVVAPSVSTGSTITLTGGSTIGATQLTSSFTAGSPTFTSTTTASVSPTTGAAVFLFVRFDYDDETDPFAQRMDFVSVSGLSATWNRIAWETQQGHAWGLWYSDDWTGSGVITISESQGTVDFETVLWSVTEITGLSTSVPYIGLTRSIEGGVAITVDDRDPQLTIGNDRMETVPTNGATLSFLSYLEGAGPVNPGYDTTNWSLLGETDDGNHYAGAIWSSTADLTPAWDVAVDAQEYTAIGLILVAAGNEPSVYKNKVLEMENETWANALDVSQSADWDVTTNVGGAGVGVAEVDYHFDHAPTSKMIDMTDVGFDRGIHQTQVGDDDHWVSAVWFMDNLSAGNSDNSFELLLRMNEANPASGTIDGYRVKFNKVNTATHDYDCLVYEVTNNTDTQVASVTAQTGTDPDDGIRFLAVIEGAQITVYADGSQILTHDTTGDTNTHTTGQYVGWGHHREHSSTSSQPFFYRWESGLLTAATPGGAGAVAAVAAVPQVAVSASSTVSLTGESVGAVGGVPAVTVDAGATVTLTTAVAAVAAVPEVTVDTSAGATVALTDAVDGVANVVAPSISSGSTVTLSSVAATAGVPTVAVNTGSSVNLLSVDGVSAVPAVAISSGATVTLASAVAAVAGVPTVTVTATAGKVINASTVAAASGVPEVTITAGVGISVATAVATADVPTVSVTSEKLVSVSVVAGVGDAPSVQVSAGAEITLVGAVSTVAQVPVVTVTAGKTIAASTVVSTATVPSFSVSSGSTVGVSSVSVAASVSPVTVSTGASVSAGTVSAVADVPPVTLTGATNVQPTTVSVVAEVPIVEISSGATIALDAVTVTTSVPAVTVTVSRNVSAGTVAAVANVPPVSLAGGATINLTGAVGAVVTMPTVFVSGFVPEITPGISVTPKAEAVLVGKVVSVEIVAEPRLLIDLQVG